MSPFRIGNAICAGSRSAAFKASMTFAAFSESVMCKALLRLDAGRADHLAPFLGFLRDQSNSAGEPGSGSPPMAARRAFMPGSAIPALISLLSLSTISAGVFLGAHMPYHWLVS